MAAYYKQKTKEELLEIVENSSSIQEIMKKLGYSGNRGNSYKGLRKYFEELEIDLSKFLKNHSHPTYKLEEILVKDTFYTNMTKLKYRILQANLLKNECAICGNSGE